MSTERTPSHRDVKGVLRKALSGHLGLHRVTTVQKVFKQNELKRGVIVKDKYAKIAHKFKLLEHAVTVEDNAGDEDNENKLVERTIYRTAFHSIVILMIFFGIGLLALFLIDGDMSFFDIVYFLVITLTTIGYGDVSPSNKYSKLFVCFYTIAGLLLFSTALSGILRYWSQQQEAHYRKEVLDRLNDEEEEEKSDDEEDEEEEDDQDSEGGEEGKIHIDDSDAGTSTPLPSTVANVVKEGAIPDNTTMDSPELPPQVSHYHSLHVPTMIYDMTDSMSTYFIEKLRIPPFAVPIIKDLLRSILHIFLIVSVGTLCFCFLQDDEDANVIDCLYLSITTITTVGYGDVVPTNWYAKLFTIFYASVGTIFTAKCIMKFNHAITNYQKQHRQDIILRSEFSLKSFFDMDTDGDNEVTKEEFLLYKILHMNLVDAEIVARIERQFNAWDVDGSGSLTTADIEIMSNRNNHGKEVRSNLIKVTRGRGIDRSTGNSLVDGFGAGAGGGGEGVSSRRQVKKSYSVGDIPDSRSQRMTPSSRQVLPISEDSESYKFNEEESSGTNRDNIKKTVGFIDVVQSATEPEAQQSIVKVFDQSTS